ncbi:CP family cyanate transporter-like MFS transporter [Afipia massiliensis]|uniref:CP family cyanate transporter-like MFS transporter n=1 Tax=Afipia massiliensis TaxID=211460 RepID=A0A840MRI6_9BRAD|nr:CP family cyanate transporter-like MFS transporter [Afipia massiliensis]
MSSARSTFGALFLLWLAGNGLRLTILAIPPVLALIILDLKLSGTEVGILNAIPVFLFALVAIPGSLLIARVGAVPALIIGLLIAAAGSALRGLTSDTIVLYITTIVMAAGIAVMQPAMPPIVRQWVPRQIGFATAVYTNGLLFGEIFPVLLAAVILPVVGGSWRASLVLWSIPLVVIALVIFWFQPGGKSAPVSRPRQWMPDWRDPLLWKLGLMMSTSNQLYFCSNAFLPGFLLHTERTDLIGPALTALNVGQLPASFILLVMSSRWERKKWPLIGGAVIGLAAIAGVLFATSLWGVLAAAAFIGFSCAVVLTLVLTLPALLVASDDVPRMSAGVFTIGYGLAMLISIIGGIAWDASGNPAFAFIPIAVATLPVILFALLTDFSKRRA